VPEAARGPGGHRLYSDSHMRRLTFIRRCRKLGFSQNDVRALLSHADESGASCEQVDLLARAHLDAVREKIGSLQALEAMIGACAGGRVEDCRIVDALAAAPAD
jgi:MerR family mercuric resistance operon transcriptional regulator